MTKNKKEIEDKKNLDEYEQDNPKTKKMGRTIAIISICCGVVALAAGIIVPTVKNRTFVHKLSYNCVGVDDNWLKTHPFVTSDLPSEIQHSKALNLTVPEITGYSFMEWTISYKDKSITLEKDKPFTFPWDDAGKSYQDVVITAKYEIVTYNVSLDLKEGVLTNLDDKDSYDGHTYNVSNGVATTTYICLDDPFTFPSANRTGYDFSNQGWLDEGRNQHYEGCDTSLLRDINLSADWTIHPYNISYSFTGEGLEEFASGIINNNPRTSNYEEEVLLTDPFVKGYEFKGWYNSQGDKVTKIDVHTFPNNDNIDLEARFEPIVYNIYYSDESNSDHTALPTSYKRCSPDIAIPAINPTGYTFKGWISSNVSTFVYTDTIPHGSMGDITFTADVELITYHATFEVTGVLEQFQGSFNLKDRDIPFTIKSNSIDLPSNPEVPGYDFVGYYDQNGHEVTNIPSGSLGDRVIVARFTPHTYQVTLVNTRGSTRTIDYTVESVVSFDNPSSTGYTFEGWLDDDGTKVTSLGVGDALTRQSFTLTSDWSLNTYNITYDYDGLYEGTPVNNDNVPTYTYETDITLEDISVSGYVFKGWYDENGNKVTTINKHTIVGDKTFTARFEAIKYTITRTYKTNGTGVDQTETTDYYVYTPEFTLPDVASTVRKFVGWKETVTQRMYYPGHKFGGGEMTNYSLVAIWSYIGEGTDEDPYQIFDLEQLQQISELDKSYILMNDLTIYSNSEDVWMPVGTKLAPFAGKLDGNGKTINMVIGADSADNSDFMNYFGIFGYLSNTAYIHDFTITGSVGSTDNRLPTSRFGLVASYNSGTIEDIAINVPVYLTSNSTKQVNIGGFVGENVNGSIINCSYGRYKIDVNVPNTETLCFGGIAGYGEGGDIQYCSIASNLVGRAKTACYVGGILGDRKINSVTRISWNQDPSSVNPVGGTISASTVNSGGNTGVYGEGYTNGVLGRKVSGSEMMSGSTAGLIVGDYYYMVTTSANNQWIVMCWVKYLGNNQWDYSNSKNQIIYAYYE